MLRDRNKNVRSIAANSLGQLGFHEGIDPLLNTLNDPENEVAWSAAEALAEMGDPEALKQLEKMLPDIDPSLVERFKSRFRR